MKPRRQKKLLIVGSGGHGKVVANCIGNQPYEFTTSQEPFLSQKLLQHDFEEFVVAIGDNMTRYQITTKLQSEYRLSLTTIVHHTSQIASEVTIGSGTVICAGAIIGIGSKIGRGCIVNTGAIIDHDCILNDFSSVAPGCTLGGNVNVGTRTAVCIGATIIHRRSIGEDSVIGAGAVVVNDIPPASLAFGVPCRVIKSRNPSDPYL